MPMGRQRTEQKRRSPGQDEQRVRCQGGYHLCRAVVQRRVAVCSSQGTAQPMSHPDQRAQGRWHRPFPQGPRGSTQRRRAPRLRTQLQTPEILHVYSSRGEHRHCGAHVMRFIRDVRQVESSCDVAQCVVQHLVSCRVGDHGPQRGLQERSRWHASLAQDGPSCPRTACVLHGRHGVGGRASAGFRKLQPDHRTRLRVRLQAGDGGV
mmetsp:Transcript_34705/g.75021  ORF Transcript_34705/g.75021 Transcript_34705/m.75021 type:complete len:207 (+) Transcript_34705:568-1188(+)